SALGPEYNGNLFSGGATANTNGGHLFRYRMNLERTAFTFNSPLLQDKVDDNNAKNNPFETNDEPGFLFGTDFGIVTDIKTAPNANVYVVSNALGRVFEIFRVNPDGGSTPPAPGLTGIDPGSGEENDPSGAQPVVPPEEGPSPPPLARPSVAVLATGSSN